MHVLFLHQAFPAQFGQLGLELTRRYGWQCSFLVQSLSNCPTPSPEMLRDLTLHRLSLPADFQKKRLTPWSQSYARFLQVAQAVSRALTSWSGPKPDLVVAHQGLGPALFVPDVLSCPVINYCEYYFGTAHQDISYRLDLPEAEPAAFYPRCINAPALVTLASFRHGYAPTAWQRDSFPGRFRHKIEVHFDGVDTALYRPHVARRVVGEQTIPAETRIVTFVARGLESMRGFDLFMRLAQRIAAVRTDVLFVVVGQEASYYGWDRLHTGSENFKDWVLKQDQYDLSRFLFLGHLEPEALAALFALSDLHCYLTVPFVLSWSLINALASGCVVLASDVPPVAEVIRPGVNGLLEPLFDEDRLLETALRVLSDPAAYAPLRRAARDTIERHYSLEVAIPELHAYYERVASAC
jgi:glycosyltransferase involved in cell wall biosynthesis